LVWFLMPGPKYTRNPEGRYLADKIGYAGLAYYEYSNGEIFLILDKSHQLSGKIKIKEKIATYSKVNGEWEQILTDGRSAKIDAGLLRIKVVMSDGRLAEDAPRLITVFGRVIRHSRSSL
jgi:hypothetical protein